MSKNETEIETETCDQSRRKLLKKSYVAPAVIALGSMSFTTEAKAGWFGGGGHHHGGSTGGSSSLSSSGCCHICGLLFKYCKC